MYSSTCVFSIHSDPGAKFGLFPVTASFFGTSDSVRQKSAEEPQEGNPLLERRE